jgi:putative phosphoesterase
VATRLLLLADTHVPARARRLPDEVWRAVDAADVVFHAGDWVDVATLDALAARAARLIGVYGNNDGAELRARLPELARERIEGLDVAVIHETGAAAGRERRVDALFGAPAGAPAEAGAQPPDLLVFGHSHIPWDSTTGAGIRLLNPGSPTDRRRQPHRTMMTVLVDGRALRDVELVRLT